MMDQSTGSDYVDTALANLVRVLEALHWKRTVEVEVQGWIITAEKVKTEGGGEL